MSLSSTTNRVAYTGNGAVDTYAYTFRVFSNTDLLVTVRDTNDAETTLALTTDYTVTGVGDAGGGSVVLVNSSQAWLDGDGDLKSSYVLVIRRVRPLTQETDIRNQGDFYPEAHEDEFDHQIMITQQQQDEIDRSVKLPETVSSSDFDPELPSTIVDAADRIPTINATSDGWAAVSSWPTATNVNNAQSYAVAAQAAQTAAEAAQAAAEAAQAAAETAQTNAETAETNAETAETNAETAATNAANSASTASTQATNASNSASTASTQATNASNSASTASTQATNASNSAISAATQASNAATSASNAATSETNAAASAAAAQTAVDSVIWRDVVFKTNADSPITVADADRGKLFVCDCSSGAITINLPAISGLTLTDPWSIGIKKSDTGANAITINRNGTDTIDGATSKTISSGGGGTVLVPDTDPSPDIWTSSDFGGSGGGALYVTGSRASPQAIVAGTGASYVPGSGQRQLWFIEGSGGHVDISANPQIVAGQTVGQELILVGRNDDQTVQFDDGNGLSLNGPAILGADSILSLFWDGSVWVEISRVRC